jgi:hypothetical protein
MAVCRHLVGDLPLSHFVFEASQSFRMNSIPEVTETQCEIHGLAIDATENRTESVFTCVTEALQQGNCGAWMFAGQGCLSPSRAMRHINVNAIHF